MTRLAAALLPFALFASASASAAGHSSAMSEEDIRRIVYETIADDPSIVLDAILENPDVVMDAVGILRDRETAERAAHQSMAMAKTGVELRLGGNAPVLGNPDGDVTVVEFFDYNCGFCKRAAPVVRQLLDTDGGVRVVMRELPILSEGSVVAAKASLAARMQGKYKAFHFALLDSPGHANKASVMRVAAEVDLDLDRLEADMESDAVLAHLSESREMAEALDVAGTPYFVVGDVIVPGFVHFEEIRTLVEEARGNG